MLSNRGGNTLIVIYHHRQQSGMGISWLWDEDGV